MYATTNEIRVGNKVEVDGQPWVVIENDFVKPGKGQAFNRIRIKNMINGRVVEKTYKSGEKIDLADVEEQTMNYLYDEDGGAVFMNVETFDQISVSAEVLAPVKHFLLPETNYHVTFYKGNPIEVVPPCYLEMTITETTPAVRGDTSGRVLKDAMTHTGFKVKIPIFIEQGEVILLDTRTGEYGSKKSK